jgi:hypothetical protein
MSVSPPQAAEKPTFREVTVGPVADITEEQPFDTAPPSRGSRENKHRDRCADQD